MVPLITKQYLPIENIQMHYIPYINMHLFVQSIWWLCYDDHSQFSASYKFDCPELNTQSCNACLDWLNPVTSVHLNYTIKWYVTLQNGTHCQCIKVRNIVQVVISWLSITETYSIITYLWQLNVLCTALLYTKAQCLDNTFKFNIGSAIATAGNLLCNC